MRKRHQWILATLLFLGTLGTLGSIGMSHAGLGPVHSHHMLVADDANPIPPKI